MRPPPPPPPFSPSPIGVHPSSFARHPLITIIILPTQWNRSGLVQPPALPFWRTWWPWCLRWWCCWCSLSTIYRSIRGYEIKNGIRCLSFYPFDPLNTSTLSPPPPRPSSLHVLFHSSRTHSSSAVSPSSNRCLMSTYIDDSCQWWVFIARRYSCQNMGERESAHDTPRCHCCYCGMVRVMDSSL